MRSGNAARPAEPRSKGMGARPADACRQGSRRPKGHARIRGGACACPDSARERLGACLRSVRRSCAAVGPRPWRPEREPASRQPYATRRTHLLDQRGGLPARVLVLQSDRGDASVSVRFLVRFRCRLLPPPVTPAACEPASKAIPPDARRQETPVPRPSKPRVGGSNPPRRIRKFPLRLFSVFMVSPALACGYICGWSPPRSRADGGGTRWRRFRFESRTREAARTRHGRRSTRPAGAPAAAAGRATTRSTGTSWAGRRRGSGFAIGGPPSDPPPRSRPT
jgi:hypothetical protein